MASGAMLTAQVTMSGWLRNYLRWGHPATIGAAVQWQKVRLKEVLIGTGLLRNEMPGRHRCALGIVCSPIAGFTSSGISNHNDFGRKGSTWIQCAGFARHHLSTGVWRVWYNALWGGIINYYGNSLFVWSAFFPLLSLVGMSVSHEVAMTLFLRRIDRD